MHIMRNTMWAVLVPHQKKGSSLTPESLMKFPWEENILQERTEADEAKIVEELQKVKDFWAAWDARKVTC